MQDDLYLGENSLLSIMRLRQDYGIPFRWQKVRVKFRDLLFLLITIQGTSLCILSHEFCLYSGEVKSPPQLFTLSVYCSAWSWNKYSCTSFRGMLWSQFYWFLLLLHVKLKEVCCRMLHRSGDNSTAYNVWWCKATLVGSAHEWMCWTRNRYLIWWR